MNEMNESGIPKLVRGVKYVAPRIDIVISDELPSGMPLIIDWYPIENPIFYVSPQDLMKIVRVLLSDVNRYQTITKADDCELYWTCGGGVYGEQLMSAIVQYFKNYTGVSTGNMDIDIQNFFEDLNTYADYPRHLIWTQYGSM
jgi:hypothetical protein